MVSRVCEEFHCLPTQAVQELSTDVDRLALEILDLRAYAAARHEVLHSDGDHPLTGEMVSWVMRVKEAELEARRRE